MSESLRRQEIMSAPEVPLRTSQGVGRISVLAPTGEDFKPFTELVGPVSGATRGSAIPGVKEDGQTYVRDSHTSEGNVDSALLATEVEFNLPGVPAH